jgi:Family of unknown function (DUF5682)
VTTGSLHLLGIRHHGPGSARSVVAALDELQPDAVLVELPADCESALRWVGDVDMQPPVALLGWVVDQPQRAAFLPFAEFSPEWQAFTWAARHGVEVRAIDLPLAQVMASSADDGGMFEAGSRPVDPLAELAAAAGDPDPERWWDNVVEHRRGGLDTFVAVAEAMTAVRAGAPPPSTIEVRREAHMRQSIRRALADGAQRVAVVCGAWHVPVLQPATIAAKVDAATLRGRPKVKVGVSWVPWSHRRLIADAGYGAGVSSPGWYAHVFAHPGADGISRWFVEVARLLRAHGMHTSPDDVIAAERAAVALAALRSRPSPGLAEVIDAAEAVLAGNGGVTLVRRQLVVDDRLGAVPPDAPQVPLARDIAAQQKRLRMKLDPLPATVELDLRTPNGRARSLLLHRLAALGVPWGEVVDGRGSSGTFRETWEIAWQPELAIAVVEAAAHGTTVVDAAVHRLGDVLARADLSLADLVSVLDRALLADLPDVIAPCVARLDAQAARVADIGQVVDTLGPVAQALRYGDVRGTDSGALRQVFDGLVVRVLAGLVAACRQLDDDAAAAMVERIGGAHAALALVDHPARHHDWPFVLAAGAERRDVHGLVQGRAVRLLHDSGAWADRQVSDRVSRALTGGTPVPVAAHFVEGFLAGSGTVLVHDRQLLAVIDEWIASLTADAFIQTVPLLRRTFGGFELGERRQLLQLVRDGVTIRPAAWSDELDERRVLAALGTVRQLLGAVPG